MGNHILYNILKTNEVRNILTRYFYGLRISTLFKFAKFLILEFRLLSSDKLAFRVKTKVGRHVNLQRDTIYDGLSPSS